MTQVVNSRKDQAKIKHWEKFARQTNTKNPRLFLGKPAPVKRICIACTKVETFHPASKFCQPCIDAKPKALCMSCSEEFAQFSPAHRRCRTCADLLFDMKRRDKNV